MFKKLIDLILYGNFWIAACAFAMCLQSQYLFTGSLEVDSLCLFIFFATLFLYAVHRIVGILKLHEYFEADRYGVIAHFRSHIRVYAVIGALGSLWYFWQIGRPAQLALVIPAILSLAYVIPFLRGRKLRLRDLDHIKIFLIAVVWAWVTVLLPALEYGAPPLFATLTAVERAGFIFAITLPFDIRDLKVDAHSEVKTLPAVMGIKRAKLLAYFMLILVWIMSWMSYSLGYYSKAVVMGLGISFFSTIYFVSLSDTDRHDYFYSGLMDGTMILQGIFIAISIYLLK